MRATLATYGARPTLHLARAHALRRAGRWQAAEAAYEAAIACDDRNPRWHAQLGSARVHLGRWDAAIDAYSAALQRDDRRGGWHAALARAYVRTYRWERAAEAWEAAVARRNGEAQWHAELGRARSRTQRWTAAAEAYETAARLVPDNARWPARAARCRVRASQQAAAIDEPAPHGSGAHGERRPVRAARRRQRALASAGLSNDPNATDLDRMLLDCHPERFEPRREIARMIARSIDDIRAAAGGGSRAHPGAETRIFTFWAQGFSDAPAIVRRCHEELRRLHPATEIVVLDAASVDEYITLPPHIDRMLAGDPTKLSDLLRLELLSRYGGVWLDATCLPRVRLLDILPQLLRPSGFFAFTIRRGQAASWFLASEPDHYLVAMMRESHYEYWRHYDHILDYYMFHHIFEALYHVDDRFRALWDATPTVSRLGATVFRQAMLSPHDPTTFQALIDGCFVHKLTYKIDESALHRDTLLARLVDRGPHSLPVNDPGPDLGFLDDFDR